ncbi:Rab GTPase [Pelomyxa schiedti]|nr:Rab GTPase [Pelomyxa schiedti]
MAATTTGSGRRHHRFEEARFNSPTWCDFCKGFVKNPFGKQGCTCASCGYKIHSKCLSLANELPCSAPSSSSSSSSSSSPSESDGESSACSSHSSPLSRRTAPPPSVVVNSQPKRCLDQGIKMVILGDMNTGKTALVTRLVRDEWTEFSETTVGASFFAHKMFVDGRAIKLEIWDTAGQERYRSLAPMFFRGAAAALIVYSITEGPTLESVRTWIGQLQHGTADPNIVIAVAGNKLDLGDSHREIPTQTARTQIFAVSDKIIFYECSAKTGQNVKQIFIDVCQRLIQQDS